MTRTSLWLPPLAYMALIFYVSSLSDPVPLITAHVWDKLLHALEYAGLATLLGRALLGEGLGALAAVVAAVLLAGAYGATDEYHQMFVASRTADVRDWVVDVIGASLGAIGYLLGRTNPAKAGSHKGSSTA
ncbi:MAG TPA: VanZ family protein [Vicinamibacterales bacterium]|jgi:VanZ family protein